ncbi:uncharacterized protein LOC113337724 isoform X3 [Papaver somniferum]|uniref:uncharacterized protein LOC113337724 isoform X3 n=1 Tax=Papaver somniferum TaxID=3469 RepID=UPI000E6F8E45|nr:uncharacterized protein LOC113337724 isoform X3 [Papaver somniferum]
MAAKTIESECRRHTNHENQTNDGVHMLYNGHNLTTQVIHPSVAYRTVILERLKDVHSETTTEQPPRCVVAGPPKERNNLTSTTSSRRSESQRRRRGIEKQHKEMREQEHREKGAQIEREAAAERRRAPKNPPCKRMRPSGIQIRESEALPHEHEDAESYEESVVLHRRVGSTSDAQNTEMPSINVREDDGVSDTYEIDEVDYDTDELHDSNTFMNQVAVVATDVRHFLGQMDVKCQHCGALHWMAEKHTNSFLINPKFGSCCLQGKVCLPSLCEPPAAIRELFDGTDAESISFRKYIREYNTTNAFTSLGCKLDTRDLKGRGPRPFSIHGELRHLTGGVLPAPGTERMAVYSQLYIYDPEFSLFVRGKRNPQLNMNVLQKIQNTMIQFNVFYTKYRQAYAILDQMSPADQNIRVSLQYKKSTDSRRYNLPTTDEIAVIVPENTYKETGVRDIILHLRENNGLKQISECHPAYLPLHYVLLFPFGELGWSPTMRQWDAVTKTYTKTKLSQMKYYSYRIFERAEEYSIILRAGKIFQEFLVDAWAATEQSKLAWLRFNQPTLRSDLYICIADMTNADLNPGDRGNPVILPSSHTGSGRNMYEIYQDSMAITRFHHHPDIFLTMTANPNWTEIKKCTFTQSECH